MKKNLLFLFFIIPLIVISQDQLLTVNDAVIGNNTHMYPTRLKQLNWRPDTKYFTYVDNNSLIAQSTTSKKEKTLLTLDILNSIFAAAKIDSIKRFPRIKWLNTNTISFYHGDKLISLDLQKKKVLLNIEIAEEAKNTKLNKQKSLLAFTKENNLFYIDNNNKEHQITIDDTEGVVNGSGYIHRSEFGITEGVFWAKSGNKIAFYRKNETMVTDYPLVDITERIATLKNFKYPMAGMKSEEVKLGIYNLQTNKTTYIQTGEPKEQYLTSIAWDPSVKYIYIGILNREQNHLKFNKYDANSGELVKTLFEEKHPKYVEPENPPIFFKENPNEFLWFSERDGFKHLYRYNTEGELINQVTKGNWVVTKYHGMSPDEKYIFISSTKDSPIERHIYKISISDGTEIKLTHKSGTHSPIFSSDYKYFIDSYSSIETPRDYTLKTSEGKDIRIIYSAANPLKNFKHGEMNIFTIKSTDNKSDLYCRMIKPIDFDSTKKYPAIIYVYGGPHSQLVKNTWMGSSWVWQYYMAQKGYVMFTLDNRGTDNRGLDFENVIHRQIGINEVEDQMQGVEYLINTRFVDKERIGLHGWSYGGFMTLSMMEKYPDSFKVGVAGGPVIDWKYYEVMYGERYMDTPQENPEGYKNSSLLNNVTNLKDKRIFVVNGAIDETVVWQNSMSFLKKCVEEDILIDYFVYPTHKHNVRGKDRIHLMKKVTRYFDDFL